ncbi:MAG: bifunctional diaminohydroxyphosphoribosylaminopyrimidine deaminase/5-amino-6-(5-phosphoribosylamino)uracil reductase RibD [Coxiellaceae bacterium]|nr:bifunctional diaminohydroxyphosphoribosylaminopyrimidine deaminase/5-amino-6-(5-phosphoribosylamino)uracil reductase RibD [Coxiellaceae bacterium]
MQTYLLKALAAAELRRGFCAPNPAVGAVLVKNDQVISVGTHWAAGHPHAEVDAIRKAGEEARDADLYVTLEPCCHQGKTPPCTKAIIDAGINRVVYAFADPNPVASRGADVLLEAGVDCQHYSLPEIDVFYKSYAYWLANKRPWVTVKLALSDDYKIAGENGQPVKISGDLCDALTHRRRLRADGLLTTYQTLANDDPKLNARLENRVVAKPLFILDSVLQLDRSLQIFKTAKSITVYHRNDIAPRDDLDCIAVPFNHEGLDLNAVILDLGKRGLHDVWVEAGARVFRSFYQNKLANEFLFYRSKKSLGERALAAFSDINPIDERALNWESLGDDQLARLTIE